MSIEDAKEKALEVLEEYGLTEPPVNPAYIAEKENLTVKLHPFPKPHRGISGFIHYTSKTIYINEFESFIPKRIFTIAHELGHYFLHKDWIENNYRIAMRNTGGIRIKNSIEETEANTFAANLLVPDFMLNIYKKVSLPYNLAILFGVSEPVIRFRMDQEK